MKDAKLDQCCLVLHALSNETRLKILKLLKRRQMCVSDICKKFNMTQPSVSHHLDILKRAKLVVSEKRGREVYYSINTGTIVDCCSCQFKEIDIIIEKR
jgi:DNA-binding transcriptional ArsR family regulator